MSNLYTGSSLYQPTQCTTQPNQNGKPAQGYVATDYNPAGNQYNYSQSQPNYTIPMNNTSSIYTATPNQSYYQPASAPTYPNPATLSVSPSPNYGSQPPSYQPYSNTTQNYNQAPTYNQAQVNPHASHNAHSLWVSTHSFGISFPTKDNRSVY
jgi:hypothetical protein